jgi:hypothetical protein
MARGRKLSNAIHRPSEQPLERFATGVLEHKQGAPALAHHLERPRRPGDAQFILQSIFMAEATEGAGGGGVRGEFDDQHRSPAAVTAIARSAGKNAFAVLPQWFGRYVLHRLETNPSAEVRHQAGRH